MKYFLLSIICCLTSYAAAPAKDAQTKPMPGMSEAQVETWVKTWQRRLHLEDWKIELQIVRTGDLKPDTLGNLKWNTTEHSARIRVLSPVDYDLPALEVPQDIEYTIVHELVHLQLSVLPRDLGKKDVEELVVNRIADALMGLDKGPEFRPRAAGSVSTSLTKRPSNSNNVAGRAANPTSPK